MFMRNSAAVFALFLVAWLPVQAASAYTMTLSPGSPKSYLRNFVTDQIDGGKSDTLRPTALNYSETSTTIDGGASADSAYSLSKFGFEITLDQTRVSAFGGYAQSNGGIFFSSDTNLDFVASGSYAATDSEGRRTWFDADLYDVTDSVYLFRSQQHSDQTVNESFTLGGAGGDLLNLVEGVLAGTIIAGHDYRLTYFTQIMAFPSTTTGASAVGFLSINFVPEPGTAVLLSLGLVGLAVSKRRERNSAA